MNGERMNKLINEEKIDELMNGKRMDELMYGKGWVNWCTEKDGWIDVW